MSELIVRVNWVPINSPKHRCWKDSDGLWHVRAIRCAADGKIEAFR